MISISCMVGWFLQILHLLCTLLDPFTLFYPLDKRVPLPLPWDSLPVIMQRNPPTPSSVSSKPASSLTQPPQANSSLPPTPMMTKPPFNLGNLTITPMSSSSTPPKSLSGGSLAFASSRDPPSAKKTVAGSYLGALYCDTDICVKSCTLGFPQ